MNELIAKMKNEWQTILEEFKSEIMIKRKNILVVGCSTSEVAGSRIGSSGSTEIAKVIYEGLAKFKKETGIEIAFQCCEHLNRALVLERHVAELKGFEEVSVIPQPKAGGSMATYAYSQFEDPVVVEFIKADYGIDIGDTFIGMHLKHVAVPVRVSLNQLGHAHVTLAKTRPKLIGGERAVYKLDKDQQSCH